VGSIGQHVYIVYKHNNVIADSISKIMSLMLESNTNTCSKSLFDPKEGCCKIKKKTDTD